jgi:hypothetical protein
MKTTLTNLTTTWLQRRHRRLCLSLCLSLCLFQRLHLNLHHTITELTAPGAGAMVGTAALADLLARSKNVADLSRPTLRS